MLPRPTAPAAGDDVHVIGSVAAPTHARRVIPDVTASSHDSNAAPRAAKAPRAADSNADRSNGGTRDGVTGLLRLECRCCSSEIARQFGLQDDAACAISSSVRGGRTQETGALRARNGMARGRTVQSQAPCCASRRFRVPHGGRPDAARHRSVQPGVAACAYGRFIYADRLRKRRVDPQRRDGHPPAPC